MYSGSEYKPTPSPCIAVLLDTLHRLINLVDIICIMHHAVSMTVSIHFATTSNFLNNNIRVT